MRLFWEGIVHGFWRWVMRVSLADWLALQARIRGFENPRLLRDRPSDGAALAAKILWGCFGDGVLAYVDF